MAHSLDKFAKSISDDVIWIKDPSPPALEDLFFDVNSSLLWMKVCYFVFSKKKKKKKRGCNCGRYLAGLLLLTFISSQTWLIYD